MNDNCNSAATDFFCYAMRYDPLCTADYDTSAGSEHVVLSTTIPHASGS